MVFNTVVIACIVLAFVLIIIEDVVHINKAKTTLFFGTLVWLLYFMVRPDGIESTEILERLNENLLDIALLWMFLMAAMTFVSYLNAKGVISGIVGKMLPERISERKLMFLTGIFAFILSSLADNITATLVCVSVLTSLNLPVRKLLRYLVVVIFGVNSGGAALVTGDVTTLMIFLAGKVHITDLFFLALPALVAVLVLVFILGLSLNGEVALSRSTVKPARADLFIGVMFLAAILSTITLNIFFAVPPVLTFLFFVSLMFLLVQFMDKDELVLDYIRRIEFDTLLFFLGVLLMVGMLRELNVLSIFPEVYGQLPTPIANYLIGILSSVLDNVPLTAALLKSSVEMDLVNWLGLTYAVGVGGSLLIIGSAAGVVAMSKIKELTFMTYLRYLAALISAYSVGFMGVYVIGNWFL